LEKATTIITRIKTQQLKFVEEPLTARETMTNEEVVKVSERHGYDKIPIVDRNNVFLGMFDIQHYWESNTNPWEAVTSSMILKEDNNIVYSNNPSMTIEEAKEFFSTNSSDSLVVLDEQNRLVKLAFEKDIHPIKAGIAISTHSGWEERVKASVNAGADLIVIDTSDAYNDYTKDVLLKYKDLGYNVPICAGNIITYEGAMFLMEAGADIIKAGMSSGSICITQREKATGRAPMTALLETERARKDFFERTGRYVPVIMDGGISGPADMIIVLSIADAIMMGNYFNKFHESAGEKLNRKGHVTRDENEMIEVVTYGEGSERAKNLWRYGHTSAKTFFAEGVEGTVPYAGRLKPHLKKDVMKIKAALSNAGCLNLEEFRKKAVIELNSVQSRAVIQQPHSIATKN
jgi:IMP dehydrogenase